MPSNPLRDSSAICAKIMRQFRIGQQHLTYGGQLSGNFLSLESYLNQSTIALVSSTDGPQYGTELLVLICSLIGTKSYL